MGEESVDADVVGPRKFWLAVAMVTAAPANAAVMVIMKLASPLLPPPLSDSSVINASRLLVGALLLGICYQIACWRKGQRILPGLGTRLRFLFASLLAGLTGIALAQGLGFYCVTVGGISAGFALLCEAIVPGVVLIFVCTSWRNLLSDLMWWLAAGVIFALGLWHEGYSLSLDSGNASAIWLAASVALTTLGLLIKAYGFPNVPPAEVLENNLLRAFATTLWASVATAAFLWLTKGPELTVAILELPPEPWRMFGYITLSLASIGSCVGWLALFHLLRHDPMLACISIILSPIVGWIAEWTFHNQDLVKSVGATINFPAASCLSLVIVIAILIAMRRFGRGFYR